MLEIYYPPNKEITVLTKDGVHSTNFVRGVSADSDVAVEVPISGKSVGVVTDVPEAELPFPDLLTSKRENTASILYIGVEIKELHHNASTIIVRDTTKATKGEELEYRANKQKRHNYAAERKNSVDYGRW